MDDCAIKMSLADKHQPACTRQHYHFRSFSVWVLARTLYNTACAIEICRKVNDD